MIDVEKGGTLQGEIDALNHLMDLSILTFPFSGIPTVSSWSPAMVALDKIDLLDTGTW